MSGWPFLGLTSCIELDLVRRVGNISEEEGTKWIKDYDDVFQSIGEIKGEPYNIKLKSKYKPDIAPCRGIAFGLMEKLKVELKRMGNGDIIEKADNESPEFVSPILIKQKSDEGIRVCIDPQALNNAIERDPKNLPTFEEITANMSESNIFSTLDAKSGFHQIVLSSESSWLTTFTTPFGRYRFKRFLFEVKVAPDAFQKVFKGIFEDIEGVKILLEIFKRAKKWAVKFNRKKGTLYAKNVKFLGHIIGQDGIMADEDRVKAILKMPSPKNKDDVKRILGMVTFVGKCYTFQIYRQSR